MKTEVVDQVKEENFDESDGDEIIQTESEEYSDEGDFNDEEFKEEDEDQSKLNVRIHQRIKQLLGSNFNKIKT